MQIDSNVDGENNVINKAGEGQWGSALGIDEVAL